MSKQLKQETPFEILLWKIVMLLQGFPIPTATSGIYNVQCTMSITRFDMDFGNTVLLFNTVDSTVTEVYTLNL